MSKHGTLLETGEVTSVETSVEGFTLHLELLPAVFK